MAVLQNFNFNQGEDALLILSMSPPTATSGVDVQFVVTRRHGGSPIFAKYYTSGFTSGIVSGISLNDPIHGVYGIRIWKQDTSGLAPGNYAYTFTSLNSGSATMNTDGYLLLQPSNIFAVSGSINA